MKIGDIVQNKADKKRYGTVEYSSFGFSIHSVGPHGLSKTLGVSEEELLKHWDIVEMPVGHKIGQYGGIVKMRIEELWVFIKTYRSSVGGNAISMEPMDIDMFIMTYKNFVPGWRTDDIRPIKLNEKGGGLLRDLELYKFEEIFAGRINTMGKLLWYYPNESSTVKKYPYFRKAVYEKYGIKATKRFDDETRSFVAELL